MEKRSRSTKAAGKTKPNGKANGHAVAVIPERRLPAPRFEVYRDRGGFRFIKIDASRRKSGKPSPKFTLRNNTRRACLKLNRSVPKDKRIPIVSV